MLARIGVAVALLLGATGTAASAAPSGAPNPVPSPIVQPTATVGAQPWTGRTVTPTLSRNPADYTGGVYIVQFAGQPAATYHGGVRGMAATAPSGGAKLDANGARAQSYREHLRTDQNRALATVGARAIRSHTIVFNGATVRLTANQAAKLAGDKSVVALTRDSLQHISTDVSPTFLDMPKLWSAVGGRSKAGKGVVVGMLDTGIWPESASFAARPGIAAPAGWKGTCVAGEAFVKQACNGKLIGARYYLTGFEESTPVAKADFRSARDYDGHGTHTASTAAGERVPSQVIEGRRFGALSGMAPAANIAAYKVCWNDEQGGDGCATSDTLAAVEDAVSDGVDVINYSIGSDVESGVTSPVELAFLNAAAAGVFVATAAGNSGPGESTLDHPSPWVTTVGASTHRIAEQKLVLGNGRQFIGVSTTRSLPAQTPMVLARAAVKKGADPDDAELCAPGTLDPAKVKGKLVVCIRGTVARIQKSVTVRDAGGVGMVLINPTENSLDGDLHFVPTVHLPDTALAPVTAYAAKAGATGAIRPLAKGESTTKVPVVAPFSSRGPSTTTGGDILKPDIAAPGVSVLAAVAPPGNFGRKYDIYSGTSMASPHIAGIAAVLHQAHPGWSPMAIKSAIMTTARDTVGTTSPFAQGAGNVQPAKATDPLVVFDSGIGQWLGYLVGIGALDPVPGVAAISGTDLNQASIASGAVTGVLQTTRTMTNVSDKTLKFTVSAKVPGFSVATSGNTTLKRGESSTLRFTFTRTTAKLGAWTTGKVILTRGNRTVTLPVALRPIPLRATPQEIDGTGTSGTGEVQVQAGSSGTVTAASHGLIGTVPQGRKIQFNENAFDFRKPADTGPAVEVFDLTTSQQSLVRFSTDAADGDDLDLWVYQVQGATQTLVGLSATSSGDEEVTFSGVPPGVHLRAYVHGYSGTDGAYTWRQWAVGDASQGNLSVTPVSRQVTTGQTVSYAVSWHGLAAAKDYLGWVDFTDKHGNAEPSLVEVR